MQLWPFHTFTSENLNKKKKKKACSTSVHPHMRQTSDGHIRQPSQRCRLTAPTAHLDDASSNQVCILSSHDAQHYIHVRVGFSFISRSRQTPTVLQGFTADQVRLALICKYMEIPRPRACLFYAETETVSSSWKSVMKQKYSGKNVPEKIDMSPKSNDWCWKIIHETRSMSHMMKGRFAEGSFGYCYCQSSKDQRALIMKHYFIM